MAETELPDPTQVEGMRHPREATALIGHDAAEAEVLGALHSGRFHSGWLVTGPRGVGKATLAYRMAAHLIAEPGGGMFGPPDSLALPEDDHDLGQVRAGSHPRLRVLRRGPNERGDRISQEIRAADVRTLKSFFHLSAPDGGRRVVIVDSADEMNPTAANAILKELEEPPPRTTLILVSHQPWRLLPTIRSRCRTLRLAPLAPEDLTAALALQDLTVEQPEALAVLAGGSVGAAIAMLSGGGLQLYEEIVRLLGDLPRLDRPRALALAQAATGRAGETRFRLTLDLLDLFLARAAQAGASGEPSSQGAPGEARLLARIAPDARAARHWADLQQALSARARHGQAVNLDPGALILDMVFRIEAEARRLIPA